MFFFNVPCFVCSNAYAMFGQSTNCSNGQTPLLRFAIRLDDAQVAARLQEKWKELIKDGSLGIVMTPVDDYIDWSSDEEV